MTPLRQGYTLQTSWLKYIIFSCIIWLPIPDLFAQPTISSFTPQSGGIGTIVTINGTNFNGSAAGNIVYFGAVKAAVTSSTPTSITVQVPGGANYQPISVTTNNLTAYSRFPFMVTFAGGGSPLAPSSMAPEIDLPVGSQPASIFVTDLDGDGKPDLAEVNGLANTLSLLKNNSIAGNISFSPKMDFPTGTSPLSVAAGDLDGDGKPDIVVANSSSNTLSVYRNNSIPGSFQIAAKIDLATGNSPSSVLIMDMDGDGRPELIVTNANDATVSVFKNTTLSGNLSFAAKQDFITGSNPQSVAVADLDGDGKPDLAVANAGSNTVSVLQNTASAGSVSFAIKHDFAAGSLPIMVVIADVDGDGKPELVIADAQGNGISILKNTSTAGAPSFPPNPFVMPGVSSSYGIAIGDVDGDGKADIVSANYPGNSSISVFRNTSTTGLISFSSKLNYGVGMNPWYVAVADLDADGMPDLETANNGSDNISILRNTVSPVAIYSFSPLVAGPGAHITISGNGFNNITDVSFGGIPADSFTVVSSTSITAVVGTGATGNVMVASNLDTARVGGFTFVPSPSITSFSPAVAGPGMTITIRGLNLSGATAVSLGDSAAASFTVDSSTALTAIVASGGSGIISVTTPGGTAHLSGFTFVPPPVITSFTPANAGVGQTVIINGSNFTGASSVKFGEISAASFTVVSDNRITALVGSASGGRVSVTTLYGVGTLPGFYNGITIHSVTPSAGPVGTTVSISGTNFSTVASENIVYFGAVSAAVSAATGTTLTVTVPLGATYQPVTVTTNKLTAYSSFPFTITFPGPDTVFSAGSFGLRTDFPTGVYPYNFSVGDLDGDGKPDLAVPATGMVSVHRNTSRNGHLSFDPKQDFSTSEPILEGVTMSDLDGDGKLDLIVFENFPRVALFRNTSSPGTISFLQPIELDIAGGSYEKVTVFDFDGDGKPDLAVPNESTNTLIIYRNTSDSGMISFSSPVTYSTGLEPQSISVGDFDGDGKPDLAVANFIDSVSIFLNTSSSGSISFSPGKSIVLKGGLSHIETGDIDGDGKPDLIVGNHMDSIVSVLRNTSSTGSISFDKNFDFATGDNPYSLSVGDLDGDGKPDIAVQNILSNTFSVLKNKSSIGAISFDPKVDYATARNPVSIFIADLNGDGKPDIEVSNFYDNSISVYSNTIGEILTPLILSFTPTSGKAGVQISITGTHFTGTTAVSFGGRAAASFTILSDTSISAVLDSGSSGEVSITTGIGTATLAGFIYITQSVDSVFRLLNFNGQLTNGHADLQWQTANEQSISKYFIQYSLDSLQFSDVDSQKVSGTGNYLFTDPQLLNSNNYYRLKITDTSGNFSYSRVIDIQVPVKPNALVVHPNPAKESVVVNLPVSPNPSILTLVDMFGNRVKTINLNPNMSQISLDVSNLLAGVYVLVWRDGTNIYKQSLLVE